MASISNCPSGKLVLIDGNALMHRAYHALPPMTGNSGQPTNAVYGLTSMLLKAIIELTPSHIAFAFDRKEPTFRRKLVESYQAHRPEMDKDLVSQFAIAKGVIQAFGIPIYDMAGYEADDVIGSLAIQLIHNSIIDEVVIVTGDRDILQLVNDKINLYMPIGGLASGKLFGEKETIERMGVPPGQIIDYKALVGDPSDNYKGVPGIGPKTAIKLLEEFGTLEDIYKNLNKLPEKTKTLLQKNKDSAFTSQTLATIVCDLDLDFSIDAMKKWKLDSKEVLNLFSEIGFKTLTARVLSLGKEIDAKKQMTLL